MDILAFPLRFNELSGKAETLTQGSDAHGAQQISQFIQTRVGELALAPGYGIEDPAFRGIESNEISTGIGLYCPSIRITEIDNYYTSEGVQGINVTFNTQIRTTDNLSVATPDGQVTFGA